MGKLQSARLPVNKRHMSKIDYDLNKIKGVVFDVDGVLSPSMVPLGEDGNPCRMANVKDGYAMQLAVRKGLKIAIISGACGKGLEQRFHNLGIEDIYLKAGVKKDLFLKWMSEHGFKPEEVAYAGDDIPDSECMKIAGLSVAPADAAVDIIDMAGYVSPANGGYGVARDHLEEILKVRGQWPECDKAWGWNK